MPDFKKEWLSKAEVDYFAQFMALWLGFNSWYRSHYSELDKSDRQFIEKLKFGFSGRNQIFAKFCLLLADDPIKENLGFKSDLESLYYSLNRASLKYPKGYYSYLITYETALYDYKHRKDHASYNNLIKKRRQPNKIKLDAIYVTSENEKIFPCIIEILYQIRCLLFHGNLAPSVENHEVVKYCYSILLSIFE